MDIVTVMLFGPCENLVSQFKPSYFPTPLSLPHSVKQLEHFPSSNCSNELTNNNKTNTNTVYI